jgi:Carbon-nitrogen hydrolase
MIRLAGVRVAVFPELSLTGYELGAKAVSPDDPALTVIAGACAETGAIALAGAPVAGEAGKLHIAALLVSSGGVQVAYRKSFLGGGEPGHFAPGDGPAALDVDGWRVGLGICKDTGVDQHIYGTAALGVDLYVAGLVHLPEELEIQEERAARIARVCNAYVACIRAYAPAAADSGSAEQSAATQNLHYGAARGHHPGSATAAPNGGSRATALTSDRHAARLVFQRVSEPSADYGRGSGLADCDAQARRSPIRG